MGLQGTCRGLDCLTSSTQVSEHAEERKPLRGPARVRELFRRFRREREDPAPFYTMLAAETVERLERRHGPVAGSTVLDVACGPGFYTDAFRARGAHVIPLEHSLEELRLAGRPPADAVIGDAARLPLPDRSIDSVFCSNMLEHTPDSAAVIDELAPRPASRRMGVRVLDELVLTLGWSRDDAVPLLGHETRTAAVRATPRRPEESVR